MYKGNFKSDKKVGSGQITYPDGRIFTGEWRDNKQHGRGLVTYPDGTHREGQWQNGKHVWWYNKNGERELSDLLSVESRISFSSHRLTGGKEDNTSFSLLENDENNK